MQPNHSKDLAKLTILLNYDYHWMLSIVFQPCSQNWVWNEGSQKVMLAALMTLICATFTVITPPAICYAVTL